MRMIDMVAKRTVDSLSPVPGGLHRDVEMGRADLAAAETGDHQQRPAPQEIGAIRMLTVHMRPPRGST